MFRFAQRACVVGALVSGGLLIASGVAAAAQPDGPATGPSGQFLCPAVGDGVTNADAHNGANGVDNTGTIASGQQTFLPGNNQAGAHANSNALNTDNPDTTAGPGGGNSDWSPIWPGDAVAG